MAGGGDVVIGAALAVVRDSEAGLERVIKPGAEFALGKGESADATFGKSERAGVVDKCADADAAPDEGHDFARHLF